MSSKKTLVIALLFQIIFLVTSQNASALPVTITEIIEDIGSDLFGRDLVRTRVDSNGTIQTVSNNSTIISENQLSSSFGIYNTTDVTYRHLISWMNPLAFSFIGLSLEVKAYGVDGGNEILFAETFNLGSLINDGILLEGFSTTIFNNTNTSTLNLLLADSILNINVDKNRGANTLGLLDLSSIFSSKLIVEFIPVPEPMTISLVMIGVSGNLLLRRRILQD